MKIKNPLIPMGAITGRPDRARMDQVLRSYKAAGVDQFLIYPRSGMEIPYMSEEWLELCRGIVETAAELEMDIWLYDEYNWPSGNCRGQVTDGHEEFYPNALVFTKDADGVKGQVVRNHLGADILNPDSVARFLALTHQKYYDALSEYFGTVIKGIFTDEPSFAYFTRNLDGTFSGSTDGVLSLAWYEGLENEYRALRGRDLHEDAAAHLNGQTPEHFWEDYYALTGERMRTVFVAAMNNWCVEHGIWLTGHLMCEDAPESVRYNGDALKMLREFSFPGLDEIPTAVSLYPDDEQSDLNLPQHSGMELSAMSLCQYAGKHAPGQLAELFALGPADLPMTVMRQMIWTVACFGVNQYVLAVAAQDPRGNIEKNSYYFPTSQTTPWFDYYRELAPEARRAAETARKPYAPQVRLRYPAAYLRHVYNSENGKRVGSLYRSLLVELVSHQVQYLYIAEDEQTDLPVIAMDERGLYLEGEERFFDNAVRFADHVNEVVPRRCIVTDENGNEVRNVLTRVWADGTVTLVDLTRRDAADRLLTVKLDGCEGTVRLLGHDVFCGTAKDLNGTRPEFLCEAETGPLTLALPQDNQIRCLYVKADPQVKLVLTEGMSDLRLLVRTEVEPGALTLDGKPVVAEESVYDMPDGYGPIYRATKPFALTAGEHVLEITNNATDHRYLPALYLKGRFAVNEDGSLRPLDGKADFGATPGIPDYTGSYCLSCEIEVPEAENLILSLNTNAACTEAFLDGEKLGTRCWTPFEWNVPARLRGGRHTLTVMLTTSIMPMFGDWKKLEQDQPHASWVSVIAGKYTHIGLMSAPEWRVSPQK